MTDWLPRVRDCFVSERLFYSHHARSEMANEEFGEVREHEEEADMKCIVCHGSEIAEADVTEEFASGNDIVCFTVRTPVCRTCGERYYGSRTMRILDNMKDKVRAGKANVREVGRVLACA